MISIPIQQNRANRFSISIQFRESFLYQKMGKRRPRSGTAPKPALSGGKSRHTVPAADVVPHKPSPATGNKPKAKKSKNKRLFKKKKDLILKGVLKTPKFVYQRPDALSKSGAIESSGSLVACLMEKIRDKLLVLLGDGNLGFSASVGKMLEEERSGVLRSAGQRKSSSFHVLGTVLESREEFFQQYGGAGRDMVQRIERVQKALGGKEGSSTDPARTEVRLKFGVDATTDCVANEVAAIMQRGPQDVDVAREAGFTSSGVILCWNFPYTTGISWGAGVAQHNDGWAIETLPSFFRQACSVWERLNRDRPWCQDTEKVDNEVPVEVWLTLREVHYAQWRLQSGKLTRRPDSKLRVPVSVNNTSSSPEENGNGAYIKCQKFQRTLGLELIDRKKFGRVDWPFYGNGAFGDSRDRAAGSERGADRVVRGHGSLPVYQDEQSSTYMWRVVVEEEKRA